MKKEIGQMIQHLEGLYSGENWVYVGAEAVINSLTAETAVQKKLSDRHTILEILQHMVAWRTFLLKRLQGDEEFNIRQDDDIDWKKSASSMAAQWAEAKAAYEETQQALIRELQNGDDSLLDRIVAKRTYTFRYLINGIIQHDFYHLGQIVLLG